VGGCRGEGCGTKKKTQRKKHIGTHITTVDGKRKGNRSREQEAQPLPPQCVARQKYEERSTEDNKALKLMETAKGIGVRSKGRRVAHTRGWGGAGAQCVPRKKHVEATLHAYL